MLHVYGCEAGAPAAAAAMAGWALAMMKCEASVLLFECNSV